MPGLILCCNMVAPLKLSPIKSRLHDLKKAKTVKQQQYYS